MKYSKFILSVLAFSLIVLTFSSAVFAFPGYDRRGMMNYHMGYGYYNKVYEEYNPLDLTEEQQEILSEKREGLIDNYIELGKELRELNIELRALIISNSDDEDIATLKDKINSLQNDLVDIKSDYWKRLQEVLSDEQLEKLDDIFKDIENESFYPVGPGMRTPGFWGGRMPAGRGFYPGGRYRLAPNSFVCPFGF